MKNIIETEVWVYTSTQEELDKAKDLGLPAPENDDAWSKAFVDFNEVTVIREAIENDFIGKGKACIHVGDERLTINMPFEEAMKIWLRGPKTFS